MRFYIEPEPRGRQKPSSPTAFNLWTELNLLPSGCRYALLTEELICPCCHWTQRYHVTCPSSLCICGCDWFICKHCWLRQELPIGDNKVYLTLPYLTLPYLNMYAVTFVCQWVCLQVHHIPVLFWISWLRSFSDCRKFSIRPLSYACSWHVVTCKHLNRKIFHTGILPVTHLHSMVLCMNGDPASVHIIRSIPSHLFSGPILQNQSYHSDGQFWGCSQPTRSRSKSAYVFLLWIKSSTMTFLLLFLLVSSHPDNLQQQGSYRLFTLCKQYDGSFSPRLRFVSLGHREVSFSQVTLGSGHVIWLHWVQCIPLGQLHPK